MIKLNFELQQEIYCQSFSILFHLELLKLSFFSYTCNNLKRSAMVYHLKQMIPVSKID